MEASAILLGYSGYVFHMDTEDLRFMAECGIREDCKPGVGDISESRGFHLGVCWMIAIARWQHVSIDHMLSAPR